jgi:hypothetical protein
MPQLTAAQPQEPTEASETTEEEPERAGPPLCYGRVSGGRTQVYGTVVVAEDIRRIGACRKIRLHRTRRGS